jgi:hypothetical protein
MHNCWAMRVYRTLGSTSERLSLENVSLSPRFSMKSSSRVMSLTYKKTSSYEHSEVAHNTIICQKN